MTDLNDAVDELTLPKTVKVMQDEGVVPVEVPPLLTQLDEAIRSSMGGSAAGATLASQGSVVNDAALFKLMQISSQVRDWCRRGATTYARTTTAALRLWYVHSQAQIQDPDYYVRTMRGWAASIRALLDPPRLLEVPGACPACGATSWWDKADPSRDGRSFPLVVEYHPNGRVVDSARGFCRACEQVWGARELAYALEQKEQA